MDKRGEDTLVVSKTGSTPNQKLIIDVDTGVDDAQAIMMALAAKDTVDIVAITCVNGNCSLKQVCYNTMRVLKACNRTEVTVYKGAESSLVLDADISNDAHHGSDGMGGVPDSDPPDMCLMQTEHAVTAISRLARLHKGDITLVCLAPLTNIALALRMDPELSDYLKNVIIMGGNIEGRGNISAAAEFNFYNDPESAHVVLHNLKCPTQLVCWEPCLNNGISWEWYDNLLCKIDTPHAEFHSRINQHTTKRKKEIHKYPTYYSCDPCAMAVAINPECILKTQKVYCTVELHGEITRAQMVVDWRGKLGRPPNVELITEVNIEQVKSLYEDMLR